MSRPDRDLFTKVTDLDARGRGEIFGGVLITVILLIVEALTGLAETGVALEFTAAGLLRVLKATGKLGVDAIRDVPTAARESVAAARQMGRGVMHGFAHGVEGTAEFLRGHGLPPEWGEAIANGPRKALGHVYEHSIGQDLRTIGKFNEVATGVHMRWKGGQAGGLIEREVEMEPRLMSGRGGRGFHSNREATDAEIASARDFAQRGLKDFGSTYKKRFPGSGVPRPDATIVDEEAFAAAFPRGAAGGSPAGFDRRRRFPDDMRSTEMENVLILNPNARNFWDNPSGYTLERASPEENTWSSGNKFHVIRHEVGHIAHENLLRARYPTLADLSDDESLIPLLKETLRSRYDPTKGPSDLVKAAIASKGLSDAFDTGSLLDTFRNFSTSEREVARQVSEYAAERPVEFVAEVFAGGIANKQYPPDVWDLYHQFLGPSHSLPNGG